ncbi:hypothetical protein LguiB_004924 [Lonicera macranthoides]
MDKCEEASIHSNFNFKTLHFCTSVVEDKSCSSLGLSIGCNTTYSLFCKN